jgi:hypothetical protein
MANKPINTSGANTGSFDDGLLKDVDGFARKPNQWKRARNAVNNTIQGDLTELSNESSNYLCATAPYTIIGLIHLEGDEWAVFSTDDLNSEIGLFKQNSCTYKTIVNAQCLNFKKSYLIKGVSRSTYDCSKRLYWDDGLNPTRFLDIDNIPWKQDCQYVDSCLICTDTTVLDCDKIRLAPLVKPLGFRVEQSTASGELINGSYYVVGTYLLGGIKIADYSLPSNIQAIFKNPNGGGSIDIFVESVDPEFDEFELTIVRFANYNTDAFVLGTYSTRQNKITIDSIPTGLPSVDVNNISIKNSIVDKTDAIYRNGKYLLRVGPTSKFDFNYQPIANQIITRWVSVEYPQDYYRDGGNKTGYLRDEVYSFFIRWVYNTGDVSRSYHIPGRVAKPSDLSFVGSADDIITGEQNIRWKIYNTASVDPTYSRIGEVLPDSGVIIGGGPMAYWESTEIYDDNSPEVWNATFNPIFNTNDPKYDLCGKPIRHHKFPDNATDTSSNIVTNHYNPIDGSKIRVMGVEFDNIQPPIDNYGNVLTNVIGYEILRGSREGNKSVLAKGMINNMRKYVTVDNLTGSSKREFLYPNYPYNPTAKIPKSWDNSAIYPNAVVDHFLSSTHTSYKGPGLTFFDDDLNANNAYLQNDIPLGLDVTNFPGNSNIKLDLLTFHSPETNFRDPYLSAKYIKVYGELHGDMVANFAFPKDHPRHKIIGNTAFLVSALIGIGYAVISVQGTKKRKYITPKIDYGGTYAQIGVSTGSTGMFGPSAASATGMAASVTASTASESLTNAALDQSLASIGLNIIGVDTEKIKQTALVTAGTIAGSTGGVGGQMEYETENTPWSATPGILRAVQGIPAFLTFWGQGVDSMLALIYSFTPYRQYALQQVSHCFYNKFGLPEIGSQRRELKLQSYVGPTFQDFGLKYKINNLFRSKVVALELAKNLKTPFRQIDDTQQLFSDVWSRNGNLSSNAFGSNVNPWEREELINSQFNKPASSYYVAMKQDVRNQYGQISNIVQVPVSTVYKDAIDPLTTAIKSNNRSPVLFNGDTYIGRYTEKNTMFFFYDWLKGQPDGAEYDYKLRKNVLHPRFWLDTDPFDVNEFLQSLGTIFQGNNSSTPGEFDYFMVNPTVQNGICKCGNYANCFFPSSDLSNLCTLENEIYQLQLYIDFLEACACFRDDGTDGCGGDDPTLDQNFRAPFVPFNGEDEASGGCDGVYHTYNNETGTGTSSCGTCPTWSNPGDYIEDGKKKWGRKIKRVQRQLRRAKRRKDRIEKKLYNQYINSLSGNDQGFFDKLFDGIVTPSDKFALDMQKARRFAFSIKRAFFYLFVSGVRDFYVETEVNIDHRDWGDREEERHYDHRLYTDLASIFSTDRIKVGNYLKYDYSLSISKLFNNFTKWGFVQDRNYNPRIAETCFIYKPKRVLYSLPQIEIESKPDNWRVFLTLNYKDFSSVTTSIKPLGKSGAIFLFESESPALLPGVDELQTNSDLKIIIGDGGLFSRDVQNLVNAEYPHEYGSCQNRLAVANTPVGIYFMSVEQGKIFQVTSNGLTEISNLGNKWWFANYLPYKLIDHPAFIDPTTGDKRRFDLEDNPVKGIGCQVVFDNKNQIVFFCKKDWVIREDISDIVTYMSDNKFLVNNALVVELGDPNYFLPASWTASFDPKTNKWISYHDWHPDLALPTTNTFVTSKDNGLWIHADTCKSYCNFYGVNYPFEVEFEFNEIGQVSTMRNIMYFLEAYRYPRANNCEDRFHVLDFNFDEAIVYNTEQCSGLLRLNLTPKNNAPEILTYPRINFNNIDILYSKEEQKYRFNQFWDITDDRGEFNQAAQRTIFVTQPNGYIKDLNFNNLNYNKFALERKKFRHYTNSVLLKRRVSDTTNIIVSLANIQTLMSSR